jgi:hypothetical protein
MYKVGVISEAYGTIPLITPLVVPLVIPLCLESPFAVPEPLLLTWNPSFALWCDSSPLWSQVACVLTYPPPFSSPSPFPVPQRLPISNTCPPSMTLQHRLHIVRYTYPYKIFIIWTCRTLTRASLSGHFTLLQSYRYLD